MISEIKTRLYELISELGYPVVDTAYSIDDKINYPFIRLNLLNVNREQYHNSYLYTYSFQIDIFTDYKGEKEAIDIEKLIFEKVNSLYTNNFVTYIRQRNFKLIDDKSSSVTKKHGIIIYDFILSGSEEK